MFADGEMAAKAKDAGIVVIDPAKIEELGGTRQKPEILQRSTISSFQKSLIWDRLVDSSVLFSDPVVRCHVPSPCCRPWRNRCWIEDVAIVRVVIKSHSTLLSVPVIQVQKH